MIVIEKCHVNAHFVNYMLEKRAVYDRL
jgi:hypothetical protein